MMNPGYDTFLAAVLLHYFPEKNDEFAGNVWGAITPGRQTGSGPKVCHSGRGHCLQSRTATRGRGHS